MGREGEESWGRTVSRVEADGFEGEVGWWVEDLEKVSRTQGEHDDVVVKVGEASIVGEVGESGSTGGVVDDVGGWGRRCKHFHGNLPFQHRHQQQKQISPPGADHRIQLSFRRLPTCHMHC